MHPTTEAEQRSRAHSASLAPSARAAQEDWHPEVAILTGGKDEHYAFGVATSLVAADVRVDVIGGDVHDIPEMQTDPRLRFLNLRGDQHPKAGTIAKTLRVLRYYRKLLAYAASSKARVFHILWNNKFDTFDRTALMLFYKLLGKKIVFTAHNVNAGKRDNTDSALNRATLRIQYHLSDNILAHTPRMRDELIADFGVPERSVTVIPYGLNNAVPNTNITRAEARTRCGIKPHERAILFFGEIAPYKGLDLLVDAFGKLAVEGSDYRLAIAGRPKGGAEKYVAYVRGIKEQIASSSWRDQVTQRLEFIPDAETEFYFKAADVLVLPYRQIFQSGVLFLAFSYGLPVVACDVGAFREDVIDGVTGFLCAPEDAGDLANALEKFFASDLFLESENSRKQIKHFVASRHSWTEVAQITRSVYETLGAFGSH